MPMQTTDVVSQRPWNGNVPGERVNPALLDQQQSRFFKMQVAYAIPIQDDVYDEHALAIAQQSFQFARTGNTQDLARLLRAGLPANLMNEQGDSLLMLASYQGHADTVMLLLDKGADPATANDSRRFKAAPARGVCPR